MKVNSGFREHRAGREDMKMAAQVVGYARVSLGEAHGQDLGRQARELRDAGAVEVITEVEHGDAQVKPALDSLLARIEAGSTLIVCEVSRLSRSTQQLCELINTIKVKRLRLVILNSVTIDCRGGEIDAMSQAFLQMVGVFSELELSMIRARVRSGLDNARAKGKKLGRPKVTQEDIPPLFFRHYPSFKAGALNVSEFARVCGLSRGSVYKYLRLLG